MEQEASPRVVPMPVLPRLDRLDRLLCYLEEKRSLSEKYSAGVAPPVELNKQCKPLSSVLEEVPAKGTLMERLAMLEKRVLQLCLEEEEIREETHNILLEETEQISSTRHTGDFCQEHAGKQEPIVTQRSLEEGRIDLFLSHKKSKRHRQSLVLRYRKWLGWIQLGC